MTRRTTAIALRKARDSHELLRVGRLWSDGTFEGYVGAVAETWAALHVLDDNIYLDGFAAVRLDDVTSLERRGGPEAFAARSLALDDSWPPPPPPADVDLTSVRRILITAAQRYRVVSIYIERDDPDVVFVGRVAGFNDKTLMLLELTAKAEWLKEPSAWRLDEITRIDFGGEYERKLLRVADAAR
ncbi:hypothetical protein ABT369_41860 [Dactylosporangium sp. NPDC000244]|uniref:hypothetical protein n=1 Tax=Dactylosporangium sp. NPDC000244 TaxID=3154365 RepID=UPI003316FD43